MNPTEIVETHTLGRPPVLAVLHADGGVSLLRGGPGNAECFVTANRAEWEALVHRMTPGSGHDGDAWIEAALKGD